MHKLIKKLSHRTKLLALLGGVLVLALAGVLAYYYSGNSPYKSPNSNSIYKQPKATNTAHSNSASSGSCSSVTNNHTTVVVYTAQAIYPSCQKVNANQYVEVINSSASTIGFSFAGTTQSLSAGQSYEIDKSVGSLPSPGKYTMSFQPSGSAQIWVQ